MIGRSVRTELGELDFLRWNTQVGKHIASYLAQLDLDPDIESDRWHADVVVASSELIDWTAAEYAAVEKSERPALPTEVLNADGCRVFGRLTKAGWEGAALVLGDDPATAELVLESLSESTGCRLGILVEVMRENADANSWSMTVTSIGEQS